VVSYVKEHEWNHDGVKYEALRWANHIQRQLAAIKRDVARTGDFLLLLAEPCCTIDCLMQYDETGDITYLEAVTPSTGSALAHGLRVKVDTSRKSASAAKPTKRYRAPESSSK